MKQFRIIVVMNLVNMIQKFYIDYLLEQEKRMMLKH